MKLSVVAVLLSLLLMACSGKGILVLTDEVLQAKKAGNEGVSKIFPVSEGQAWEIAEAVFRWEKTDAVLENHEGSYMITSSGMQMVAFGTVLGVWFEPETLGSTKITVIARHRDRGDMFTRLTAERFFQRFGQGVSIVRKGGKLPAILPLDTKPNVHPGR